MDEFPARYDPKPVERKWYGYWEAHGLFRAASDGDTIPNRVPRKAFSIVIPPPNITGSLHVGHALNNTLQDIQIRLKKLQGYETLWLPGTDHASIGTHTHLDRQLASEGKTRFDIGREEFLKRAWSWKEKYGNRIIEQLKLLGCACDWSRTRFTMDETCSRAVREAFVRYYEEGLIYRGNRIVNWCPCCNTAISDLEVKHKDQNSHWWYIRYPVKSEVKSQESRVKTPDSKPPDYVVVATTRPETMLGDTAVAVNPADKRYAHLVGRKLMLPLAEREIPVIADELVLADFGTGAVKVTPAHDATDFEIGRKHGLETVKVIDENGRMTRAAPERYQGLTREECRKRVVQDLEAAGRIEKIEPYRLSAAVCERCGTVIEPLVSEQWFLRMKQLAEPAIKAVEGGSIKFIPERWTKVYLDWMYNIRDWCISRQLWWGHRIPVFYCDTCGEVMVPREDPTECRKCGSRNIRQDEDILDTWFSSALWPFSTMGWPEKTQDLARFYPTDSLSTAPDIIFLWVARMIFSGLKFMGAIPFDRVYFHSFILVETGERMSRSRGVGLDPVELFEKYGTDAVRFTLSYLESQSQSYRLAEKRFEFGRNFTNKVWNAARLLYPFIANGDRVTRWPGDQVSGRPTTRPPDHPTFPLLPVDKWIISRYNRTVKLVTEGIEACMYSAAAAQLYDFFWHELCDWYLEFAKPRLRPGVRGQGPGVRETRNPDPGPQTPDWACRWTLYHVLRGTLQLLHPMMPFITEELWQRFRFSEERRQSADYADYADDTRIATSDKRQVTRGESVESAKSAVEVQSDSIMTSSWPEEIPVDMKQAAEVETLRELIIGVRNIRSEMNVPASARVECLVNTRDKELAGFLLEQKSLIAEQAKVSEVRTASAKPGHASVVVLPGLEAYVPLEGLIDFDKEKARIQKELTNAEGEISRIRQRLANESFRTKAKPEVVEREQERLARLEERRTRLAKTQEGL